VNKILKDIIVRARTLAGFDAPYIPGWDCHGLPIEHQIEKKHGKHLEGNKVRQLCRAFAAEQIERQKKDFIRLGVRPTLGDGLKPVLEVHLLDFDRPIYGEHVTVHFLHKLRDEMKFASLESLSAQIARDVAATRNYFASGNQNG